MRNQNMLRWEPFNVDDALRQAGMNFNVGTRPVYPDHPTPALKGVRCLVNQTTGRPVGNLTNVVVGSKYTPIQYTEGFGLVDALLERGGKVASASSWDGGKYGQMTLDFGDMESPDGNSLKKQMTITVPHDGKTSVNAKMWAWREVCSNGMMGWGMDQIVRVRHTSGYKGKLAEAERLLTLAEEHYQTLQAQLKAIGRKTTDIKDVDRILKELVPDNPQAKSNTKAENKRNDIHLLSIYGEGNGHRTLYDLYNGVVEYVDHHKETQKNMLSAYYGAGANLKRKALETMLAEV